MPQITANLADQFEPSGKLGGCIKGFLWRAQYVT